jgi:hypothetical protein
MWLEEVADRQAQNCPACTAALEANVQKLKAFKARANKKYIVDVNEYSGEFAEEVDTSDHCYIPRTFNAELHFNPTFFQLPDEDTSAFFGFELEVTHKYGPRLHAIDELEYEEMYNCGHYSGKAYAADDEEAADAITSAAYAVEGWLDEYSDEDYIDRPLYLKRDGSLPAHGVEIVSNPFSKGWFYAHEEKLRELFEKLRSYDIISHDCRDCGLHVHIGLAQFRDPDLASVLIAYLVTKLWDSGFRRFSRRKTYNFCTPIADDTFSARPQRTDVKVQKILQTLKISKYRTVSVKAGNTVEVRLFQGTLKFTSFVAAVQLCFNLAELVNQFHSYDDPRIKAITFSDIVNVNPTPHLLTYCGERGIEIDPLADTAAAADAAVDVDVDVDVEEPINNQSSNQ